MNKQSIKKNKIVKNTKSSIEKESKVIKKAKQKSKAKNVKEAKATTKEKVAAIIGLVILSVFLLGLVVALITANGKLTMAMLFSLTFVSILLFVVLRLYK